MIKILDAQAADFASAFLSLRQIEEEVNSSVEKTVDDILAHIRREGDEALLAFTRRFDLWDAKTSKDLEIPQSVLQKALADLAKDERDALEKCAARIRAYHLRQLQDSWMHEEKDGTRLGQKITPLDRVGLYVPGGQAAYPSSVLMNAIPAVVAGVGELIMVTPTPQGVQNTQVLAAAALAGVHRVFSIGGAQAVGALAFGTATVPAVDKIVGPGNIYVATAKRRVFGRVGIDMVAGPSEVLIIADGSGPPQWAAFDLMAQAEHDPHAQAMLFSPDAAYLKAVENALHQLLPQQPRHKIIAESFANRGALIKTKDLAEACALANQVAPEHLELAVSDPDKWLPHLRHAGAIFLGHFASEALGDYCAGPNHVLPTGGSARFSSPLGVYDFQKRTSLISVTSAGAAHLSPLAATVADAEGLSAHAAAARARLS